MHFLEAFQRFCFVFSPPSAKQNYTDPIWETDESESYLFEAGKVSAETSFS